MRVRSLWAALAVLIAAAPATARPPDWMLRLSEAARTLNFEGVLVHDDGEGLETLRIVHRYAEGQERQRMVALTGEPREVLRQADASTYLYPVRRQLVREEHAVKRLLAARPGKPLDANYELVRLGEGRVAGRECEGYFLRPRDNYRYGYQLWLDREHQMPLKIALVDESGRPLERLIFTEVRFPRTIPDQALQAPPGSEAYAALGDSPARGPERPLAWAPHELPPGFKVQSRDRRWLPDTEVLAEHVLVSDGLATVSLYSVPVTGSEPGLFQGMSHMGALHAYRRRLGRYHLTVVGEVPVETVRMIGDSVDAEQLARHDR